MKTRIITSVVALAVLFTVLFFYDSIIFNIVVAVATLMGVHEIYTAFKLGEKSRWIFGGFVPFTIFLFCAPFEIIEKWGSPAIYLTLLYFVFCIIFAFPKLDYSKIAGTVLYSSLLIACFYSWVALKYYLPPSVHGQKALFFLGLSMCYAWGNDTMAYFTGFLIGKHKLAPELSPKKTIEGAIGGVLGGIGIGLLFTYIMFTFFIPFSGNRNLLYGLIAVLGLGATLLSIAGDLFASAIKRQMGIKDYGTIFPGHGGILDRFDSVLLIAPMITWFASFLINYVPTLKF